MLSVGDKLGDFTLAGHDFKGITGASLRGKVAILAFFPYPFSGGADEGCEMQLCALNTLIPDPADPASVAVLGVTGALPFANRVFAKQIDLDFPLCSDPALTLSDRAVGTCDFGKFFKEHGISDALTGAVTTNRGCIIADKQGTVVYAFSGDGHPGLMPSISEIKAAIIACL